jgi:hypothetical protein
MLALAGFAMSAVVKFSSLRSDSFMGYSSLCGFGGIEQFVEERAEVDHGLTQVFS